MREGGGGAHILMLHYALLCIARRPEAIEATPRSRLLEPQPLHAQHRHPLGDVVGLSVSKY